MVPTGLTGGNAFSHSQAAAAAADYPPDSIIKPGVRCRAESVVMGQCSSFGIYKMTSLDHDVFLLYKYPRTTTTKLAQHIPPVAS